MTCCLRSGCALAWNSHWVHFSSQTSPSTSAAATTSPSTAPSPSQTTSDLSFPTNTPWAVRYARASIIEVCTWVDSRANDSSASSASAAAWTRALQITVFIKFVCRSVSERVRLHADALMLEDSMQAFVETLDACCALQKNIIDICEPGPHCSLPSALAAFYGGEHSNDMFETWL